MISVGPLSPQGSLQQEEGDRRKRTQTAGAGFEDRERYFLPRNTEVSRSQKRQGDGLIPGASRTEHRPVNILILVQ